MRRIRSETLKGQSANELSQLGIPLDDGTAMLALIQSLIPLGLKAVEEALSREVTVIAGRRYAHEDDHTDIVRWGTQPGSIYVADQKLPIRVPAGERPVGWAGDRVADVPAVSDPSFS